MRNPCGTHGFRGWSKPWSNSCCRHAAVAILDPGLDVFGCTTAGYKLLQRALHYTRKTSKSLKDLCTCFWQSLSCPVSQQIYCPFQTQSKTYSTSSLAEESFSSKSRIRWSTGTQSLYFLRVWHKTSCHKVVSNKEYALDGCCFAHFYGSEM